MATIVGLLNWLNNLPHQIEPLPSDFQAAAEEQRERIKERTEAGMGVEGNIFPPYAKATQKSPPVNLEETGDMMGSIMVAADYDGARIFFSSSEAEQKARYHNEGTKHMPQRKFFGVSYDDQYKIGGTVFKRLMTRLKALNWE